MPVTVDRLEDLRFPVEDVVGDLPDPSTDRTDVRLAAGPGPLGDDPLLEIPPKVYVERLLGVAVPRHGKVRCPFHADERPSLHVYERPERGWFCFGCGVGGSIYDLASLLQGRAPRGASFLALRHELRQVFLPEQGA